MLKILSFIFIALTVFACRSDSPVKHKPDVSTNSGRFFDFDQIDYYVSDFDDAKLAELNDNRSRSEVDSLKNAVLLGGTPEDLSDLEFINHYRKLGFTKRELTSEKFDSINKLFCEKPFKDLAITACIYVFRDILIFKKNKKTVGVAKICFDCLAHQITGAAGNTEYFGQNGDYQRLRVLLRK